jgi:hypothetical protein
LRDVDASAHEALSQIAFPILVAYRLAEAAGDVFSALDLAEPFLCGRGISACRRFFGFGVRNLCIDAGGKAFVAFDVVRVQAGQGFPSSRIGLRILDLQAALLFGRGPKSCILLLKIMK